MKIRIEATKEEIENTISKLNTIFIVKSISKLYKNRNSNEYRIYIEIDRMSEDFSKKKNHSE